MKPFLIKNKSILCGKVNLPGDKSIAHRALILSALSCGKTILKNFPVHEDSLATLNALSALGVAILRKGNQILVSGKGRGGLRKPGKPIFAGNSGTTLRLLLGVLAAGDFKCKITAGKYLSLRPMARVNVPLRLMGADIRAKIKANQEYAPIVINGGHLKGIVYRPPVASAQVKSAMLLAGLSAKGRTRIIEGLSTRDHTERMLKFFGANISVNNKSITLNPDKDLITPGEIYIPGDISSAAFFMVLAAIAPGSKVSIERVSLNPGRIGIIKVLKRMKAKIKVTTFKRNISQGFEPLGNIVVSSSKLKSTMIAASEIPSLIDELPILMVVACLAQGKTIIKDAGELRVKETDRINSMVKNLKGMGADISVSKTGSQENIIIKGKGRLFGANLKSFGDHRTAMSMIVAALAAEGKSRIDDVSCINKSFPGFLATLQALLKG
ncbi:MAG: 3-phosphoshikimate 1-carboxyvinyltransferase [Candidatus Omnitrophica bacterium CG11_big_fil_rev_8_21_14_0_20_41_12]|nr:MAG: 3-phosphoshikimate 1-carboxyvinyltransferase [Candidatus Omnitrophica bacterium CG11_big_fil_rev_8_21_14_0_20_41_12]